MRQISETFSIHLDILFDCLVEQQRQLTSKANRQLRTKEESKPPSPICNSVEILFCIPFYNNC